MRSKILKDVKINSVFKEVEGDFSKREKDTLQILLKLKKKIRGYKYKGVIRVYLLIVILKNWVEVLIKVIIKAF